MNRGQITVPIVTREAITSKLKFQDAKVRRPILAVKDSCKAGNLVLFNEDISPIIPMQSREGQQIRARAKQAALKVTLDEVNGVYVMPAWTNQPPSPLRTLFRGGVRRPRLRARKVLRETCKT